MLRLLALALVALIGSTPMTDDLLRSLSQRVAALETEAIRSKRTRDAFDADRMLAPRSLAAPIGIRGMTGDRTPDLATPLLARLRDDASVASFAGRTDTFDGYANALADPTFDTYTTTTTTIGTGYTALGPEWEAKYVLNSGTVATTRTSNLAATRAQAGFAFLSSAIAGFNLIFNTNASDMTVYLRTVDAFSLITGLDVEPSWLVGSLRMWPTIVDNVTITAYLEIVDSTDTVLASGDVEDVAALADLVEQGLLAVAYEGPAINTQDRWRLRVDITKTAGATGQAVLVLGEPLLSGSNDGSSPAFTPAVGAWLPGAPGRQLITRSFVADNVGAGATTVLDVSASGFPGQVPEVWGGSIVGLSYRWTANITGGTHSLRVTKNGSTVWTPISGASSREGYDSQSPFLDTFVAGDTLNVEVVTGGGFLPAGTNDIVVVLYLLLDYDAT